MAEHVPPRRSAQHYVRIAHQIFSDWEASVASTESVAETETMSDWMYQSSGSNTANADAARVAADFEMRCAAVKISKTQINSIIMDYLVTEGYPKAAQDFAREANIQPSGDVDTLQARKDIKLAIYGGKIKEAIEMINEINPLILERDQSLHFALMRLHLIELIKECNSSEEKDIQPALQFATDNLAPVAPTNPQFLNDLEQTLALLIFDEAKLTPPLEAILDPQLRVEVAKQVNEAILRTNGEPAAARLIELLKTRYWAESEARRLGKSIPDRIDIGLDPDGGPKTEADGDSVVRQEEDGNGEDEQMAD